MPNDFQRCIHAPNTPPWCHATLCPLNHFIFHTGSHANTKLSPYQFPMIKGLNSGLFKIFFWRCWPFLVGLGFLVSFLPLFWQGMVWHLLSNMHIHQIIGNAHFQRWIHAPNTPPWCHATACPLNNFIFTQAAMQIPNLVLFSAPWLKD